MLLILMMSLFAVALALDEYHDNRRAMEDLRIETCAELETEDFEWDEDGADNGDGKLRLGTMTTNRFTGVLTGAFITAAVHPLRQLR